jgi:hypothetical protein
MTTRTLKVTIVKSNPDAVQAKAAEELGIGILEEVFQELQELLAADCLGI